MTTNNNISKTVKTEMKRAEAEYPEIRDIRNDLTSIKKNVGNLAQHAMEAGSDNMAALRERAGEQVDRMIASGKDGVEKLEKRVRARPGQSLLAAFAAGIVISFLFGRK